MENKQSLLGIPEKSSADGSENKDTSVVAVQNSSVAQSIETPTPVKPEKIKVSIPKPPDSTTTKVQNTPKINAIPKITPQILQQIPNVQSMQLGVQPTPSMPNIQMPQTQQMPSGILPSQADILKFTEAQVKKLRSKVEDKLKENESSKIFAAFKPAFQNIESSLKFQASLNQKDKDFNTEHYTTPLTQSQFNLTSNQITNMPSWRN